IGPGARSNLANPVTWKFPLAVFVPLESNVAHVPPPLTCSGSPTANVPDPVIVIFEPSLASENCVALGNTIHLKVFESSPFTIEVADRPTSRTSVDELLWPAELDVAFELDGALPQLAIAIEMAKNKIRCPLRRAFRITGAMVFPLLWSCGAT